MCTGPYKLGDWKPGDGSRSSATTTTGTRSVKPLVQEIDFKGTPDEAALTSALLTGERERLPTRSRSRRSTS